MSTLLETLRSREWDKHAMCDWCLNMNRDGHKHNCELAGMIATVERIEALADEFIYNGKAHSNPDFKRIYTAAGIDLNRLLTGDPDAR